MGDIADAIILWDEIEYAYEPYLRYCRQCNQLCGWMLNEQNKWILMDLDTDEEHDCPKLKYTGTVDLGSIR